MECWKNKPKCFHVQIGEAESKYKWNQLNYELHWIARYFGPQIQNQTDERRNILFERNKFNSIEWMFWITNYHLNG